MLNIYYNSDTVLEITDANIIRAETFLPESSMLKGRPREINDYLLYSLIRIITFNESAVGVMGRVAKEDKK